MDREGDVHIGFWAASVVLDGPVAGHRNQIPLAVCDEATNIPAIRRFLDEIQLNNWGKKEH